MYVTEVNAIRYASGYVCCHKIEEKVHEGLQRQLLNAAREAHRSRNTAKYAILHDSNPGCIV